MRMKLSAANSNRTVLLHTQLMFPWGHCALCSRQNNFQENLAPRCVGRNERRSLQTQFSHSPEAEVSHRKFLEEHLSDWIIMCPFQRLVDTSHISCKYEYVSIGCVFVLVYGVSATILFVHGTFTGTSGSSCIMDFIKIFSRTQYRLYKLKLQNKLFDKDRSKLSNQRKRVKSNGCRIQVKLVKLIWRETRNETGNNIAVFEWSR
jgi:hypothetical protein